MVVGQSIKAPNPPQMRGVHVSTAVHALVKASTMPFVFSMPLIAYKAKAVIGGAGERVPLAWTFSGPCWLHAGAIPANARKHAGEPIWWGPPRMLWVPVALLALVWALIMSLTARKRAVLPLARLLGVPLQGVDYFRMQTIAWARWSYLALAWLTLMTVLQAGVTAREPSRTLRWYVLPAAAGLVCVATLIYIVSVRGTRDARAKDD